MKRKLCALLLFVAVAAFSVCSLSACDKDEDDLGLKMGVRYIRSNLVNAGNDAEEHYLVFHSNGTGEYVYKHTYSYYAGETSRYNYTITFKYTYTDAEKSTVVCFYDSISYGEDHNQSKNSRADWSMTIGVSKNVLIALDSASSMYINENYIKNIPNYKS